MEANRKLRLKELFPKMNGDKEKLLKVIAKAEAEYPEFSAPFLAFKSYWGLEGQPMDLAEVGERVLKGVKKERARVISLKAQRILKQSRWWDEETKES